MSATGGIINAYNAVMDADSIKTMTVIKEPEKTGAPTKTAKTKR